MTENNTELEEICTKIDQLFLSYFQAFDDYEQQQDMIGQYMRSVTVTTINNFDCAVGILQHC